MRSLNYLKKSELATLYEEIYLQLTKNANKYGVNLWHNYKSETGYAETDERSLRDVFDIDSGETYRQTLCVYDKWGNKDYYFHLCNKQGKSSFIQIPLGHNIVYETGIVKIFIRPFAVKKDKNKEMQLDSLLKHVGISKVALDDEENRMINLSFQVAGGKSRHVTNIDTYEIVSARKEHLADSFIWTIMGLARSKPISEIAPKNMWTTTDDKEDIEKPKYEIDNAETAENNLSKTVNSEQAKKYCGFDKMHEEADIFTHEEEQLVLESTVKTFDNDEIEKQEDTEIEHIGERLDRKENESILSVIETENTKYGDTSFIPDEEGKKRIVEHVRYERSQRNRSMAIKIHGTSCSVCKFDFNECYGLEYANDYIEIHHIRSIAESTSIVNPATDLFPLCSNCHSMAHRRRGIILSIDELKKLIKGKTQLR